ncbi:hypothetical protein LOK49_LG06G01342 [Camellia lanceoleosa]|uniref:Uncharacterized protein n=1 Tax=Camellia lanceoleosa TaxID=1840588 RepID=A0ACC0H9K9_9ERIC|nr:hypothetical protein LOK49_LG06G01342 [Camellia lanceoleosa]
MGGIWLLWDMAHVNVQTFSVSNQYIHATIHKEDYEEWVLSAVYASPNPTTREALWEEPRCDFNINHTVSSLGISTISLIILKEGALPPPTTLPKHRDLEKE